MTTKIKAPATAEEMMSILADVMRRASEGEIAPASANATVNAAAAQLRVVKMQMDYARLTNRTPSIPLLLTASADK